METTTQSTSPIVIPEIGQVVKVQYGADHVIVGRVVDVDHDSTLIRKNFEIDGDGAAPVFPEDEAWSLFHVEQADALCTVAVLP